MYDKRVFGLFILFAVAACLRPAPLRAGNTLDFFFPEVGDPTTIRDDMAVVKPIKWESDSEPVSFVIFKPSSGTSVLPLLLNLNGVEDFEILEAVGRALGQWKNGPAWSNGPRHSLKIDDDPIFSFQLSGPRPSDIGLDGFNLVTFQSATLALPAGALAVTTSFFFEQDFGEDDFTSLLIDLDLIENPTTIDLDLNVDGLLDIRLPIRDYKQGELIDVDIAFDPNTTFVLLPEDPADLAPDELLDVFVGNDIQFILTHEFGHAFGVAHTWIVDAVMVPLKSPTTSNYLLRELKYDDLIGASRLYPGVPTSGGAIIGQILDGTNPTAEFLGDPTNNIGMDQFRVGAPVFLGVTHAGGGAPGLGIPIDPFDEAEELSFDTMAVEPVDPAENNLGPIRVIAQVFAGENMALPTWLGGLDLLEPIGGDLLLVPFDNDGANTVGDLVVITDFEKAKDDGAVGRTSPNFEINGDFTFPDLPPGNNYVLFTTPQARTDVSNFVAVGGGGGFGTTLTTDQFDSVQTFFDADEMDFTGEFYGKLATETGESSVELNDTINDSPGVAELITVGPFGNDSGPFTIVTNPDGVFAPLVPTGTPTPSPTASPSPTPTPPPTSTPTPTPLPRGVDEPVGTLQEDVFPDTGFLPLGADIGDIDRDGYLDLVVAVFAGGLDAAGGLLNRVYLNQFAGTMPVEFTGDGADDLTNVITTPPPRGSQPVTIVVQIDQANLTPSADTFTWRFIVGGVISPLVAQGVAITGSPQNLMSLDDPPDPRVPAGIQIMFGSPNGHKLLDQWTFVVSNRREFVDVTFGADGTPGNFDDKIVPPSRDNSRDVKLADFDGDGDLDMFVSNAANANSSFGVSGVGVGGLNRIYVNTLDSSGNFQFIEVSQEVLPGLLDRGWEEFLPTGFKPEDIVRLRSQRDDSTRVAIADIDSDGDLDIVVSEFIGISDGVRSRVAVDNDPGGQIQGGGIEQGDDTFDNETDISNSIDSPLRFVERILINYNLSAGQALPNQVLAGDKRRQTGLGFAFVDETLGADGLFGDGEILAQPIPPEPTPDPLATPTPTDMPTPTPTPAPPLGEVFQSVLVPTFNTDRVPPTLPSFIIIGQDGDETGFQNSPMGYHSFMPRLGPMYHDGGLDLLSIRAFTDDLSGNPDVFHLSQSAFHQNLDLFGPGGPGTPPDGVADGYFANINYGLDFHSRNGSGLFVLRQGEEDPIMGTPGAIQFEVQPLLIGIPDGTTGDFQGQPNPELNRVQIFQRGAFAGVIEDWEYRGAPKPVIVSDDSSAGTGGFGPAVVYRPFETGEFTWIDSGSGRFQNGNLGGFGTMFREQENGRFNDLIAGERRQPGGPMIIGEDIIQLGQFGETRDAASVDFDHDGDFDLVLAETVFQGFDINGGLIVGDDAVPNHILFNDGINAVFTDVSDEAFNPNIPNQSFAVVVGDIDNDSDEDLVFFNAFDPPQLFLNGLYTRPADIVSDADPTMFYDQTPRFLPPYFNLAIGPGVGGRPRNNTTVSVAAADFNGDGRPDLATADGGLLALRGFPTVLFHNGVLRSDGAKVYKPIGATYPPPIVLRPSTFNPFPTAPPFSRPRGGQVSHGFLDDDFRGAGLYFDVSTGDFNSDGWPDLFFTRNGDGVSLYLNFDSNDPAMKDLSGGAFVDYTSHPDNDAENVINPTVFDPGEDTNHNGISDDSFIPDGIFVNSVDLSRVLQDKGFTDPLTGGPPVILPFNGQVFDPGKNENQFHTKRLHRRMATADFDFNGALDVVIANGIDGGGAPNVLLMNEIVVFQESVTGGLVVIPRITAPVFRDETESLLPISGEIGLIDNTYAVAAADFDHDGDIDIIFANQGDAPDGSAVINTFRFLRNRLISPEGQPQGIVGFDEVNGVIPPINRPGRLKPRDIIVGDFDGLGVNTFDEDLNGNGALDPGEDSNGDGLLDSDQNEDDNGNGFLDQGEDANNDGQLGIGEDLNSNGILDPGEDLDGDGRLDIAEDLNGNGVLDTAINEDANGNGALDLAEDLNGNGIIDVFSEDLNGNGILEILNEDLNNNGILDLNLNEDLNSNGELDVDEDVIRNGVLDSGFNEDLNGNGQLDVNEDLLRNGVLDLNVSEDINNNGIFDDGEDFNGDGMFQVLVSEDANHNFIEDEGEVWTGPFGRPQQFNEDTNGNGILDPGEDLNGDGILQAGVSEDLNGNGVLDTLTEDLNGDGVVDIPGEDWNRNGFPDFIIRTEDLNGDGILNDGIEGPLINEDLNGDGMLSTVDEDLNGNGVLDTSLSEDLNGNNILDNAVVEDVNGNGIIDETSEDVNGNGILDPTEDLNGNNILDTALSEDLDGDGRLDVNEDRNNNGILDGPEDVNGNGVLDKPLPSWDLYITYEDGTDVLLLNNNLDPNDPVTPGQLRFIDASDRVPASTGNLPSRGGRAGDVNGDGLLDIVFAKGTTDSSTAPVQLLINARNGQGRAGFLFDATHEFPPPVSIRTGAEFAQGVGDLMGNGSDVQLLDVDGDGDLDVYVGLLGSPITFQQTGSLNVLYVNRFNPANFNQPRKSAFDRGESVSPIVTRRAIEGSAGNVAVFSAEPSVVFPGNTVSIAIQGMNFSSDSEVEMGEGIFVTRVDFVNSDQLLADIKVIGNARAGVRAITVRSPSTGKTIVSKNGLLQIGVSDNRVAERDWLLYE